MDIDARTQLFLFGNGQFDIFACPNVDLYRMLEVHWFPDVRNQPSIEQVSALITELAVHQQLLRGIIRSVKQYHVLFDKMEMWRDEMVCIFVSSDFQTRSMGFYHIIMHLILESIDSFSNIVATHEYAEPPVNSYCSGVV